VIIEGIALNATQDYLDIAEIWQIYVQAEAPDTGGIAVFSGVWWWGASWCPYPTDINAGDRIRVEGFIDNHNGKVNLNERHSQANAFTVTVLESDVGMPTPIDIPSVAACNYFDQTRSGGGELYQGQWVRMTGLEIVSGTWAAGEELIVTDDTLEQVTLLLSETGDFDAYSAPTGQFDAVGVFDQEDETDPFQGNYRLWVKKYSDLTEPTAVEIEEWEIYK
jgi:hypothetical protein